MEPVAVTVTLRLLDAVGQLNTDQSSVAKG